MPSLNILVLGETGVGKSTWINGILNYQKYDSLEEAIEKPLLWAIPMSFVVTDAQTYEQQIVTLGEDPNERIGEENDTQSSTQFPRAYTFSNGKSLVRIIDTPGIGDTRGLAQDEKNFENILAYLRDYVTELHGICILMPPDMSRSTIAFILYLFLCERASYPFA